VLVACGLDVGGLGAPDEGGVAEAGLDGVLSAEGGAEGSTGIDAWSGADAGGHEGGDAGAAEGAGSDAKGEASNADGPAPEAGCTGVTCNGVCTNAPDCQTCNGAPLLCAGTKTCGADCAACPSSPIECFACDITRRNPIGTCEANDPASYCLNTNYAGAYNGGQGYHCACYPGACPGATQVCMNVGGTGPLSCFTCGEAYTQAGQCENLGNCNAQQAKCN
jgi:hypothetical protein